MWHGLNIGRPHAIPAEGILLHRFSRRFEEFIRTLLAILIITLRRLKPDAHLVLVALASATGKHPDIRLRVTHSGTSKDGEGLTRQSG